MAGVMDTFSKGIATLNIKTSKLLEQNKVNTHISTLENEIEALENKAGHILWEKWKEGIFSIDDVEGLLLAISERMDEIEEQKKHLDEIRREEQKILGTRNESSRQQTAESHAFCSNCGAQVGPNFKFCTKCGAPLNG